MAMSLIPFTLAWLIGIWIASRVALPTVAPGIVAVVAIVGIILAWRAPRLISGYNVTIIVRLMSLSAVSLFGQQL